MKIGSYEKLTSAIDEKTLGKILDEREKRLKKLDIKKEEITDTKDNYEELVIEEETRGEKIRRIIFKTLSVAAAVALIAGMIYVARIPLHMNNNVPTPAAGTEETKNVESVYSTEPDEPYPERVEDYFKSWTDPDRTDKISPEDAGKIKEGMTLREVVKLLGKPKFDVGSGGFVMEWAIDNGEFLHVTIGSNRSYIENRESIGDFYVITYTIDSEPVTLAEPITEPPATETIK